MPTNNFNVHQYWTSPYNCVQLEESNVSEQEKYDSETEKDNQVM